MEASREASAVRTKFTDAIWGIPAYGKLHVIEPRFQFRLPLTSIFRPGILSQHTGVSSISNSASALVLYCFDLTGFASPVTSSTPFKAVLSAHRLNLTYTVT